MYVPTVDLEKLSSDRADGKIADEFASTLACTTVADALVNYRKYVLQRTSNFPIAPMGKLLTCLPPTHALHNCECFGQLYRGCVLQRP